MTDEILERAAKLFCEKTGDDPLALIPATNDPHGPVTPRWKLIAASIQFYSLISDCIAEAKEELVQKIDPSPELAAAIDKLK